MSSLTDSFGHDLAASSLRVGGAASPRLVNALYPMEAMTKWHYGQHIKALTGRWMDGGANYLTGVTRGSFHRLAHGHHLFEDGFRVLVNPDLKFGEFLHHLGLDALTKRGVPNPLLPTSLRHGLEAIGLPKPFVYELMTLNVPKVLGGSLALVCSGTDVYLAFSDAIPHTFGAAGLHLLFGAVEIALGLYPPNFLLLTAGLAEIGIGVMTGYRAVVDPVLPFVGAPGSVYFPLLQDSMLLGALFGACVGYWSGNSMTDVLIAASAGATASGVSSTVALAAASSGFLAPFLGAGAGMASALLLRHVLHSLTRQETGRYQPVLAPISDLFSTRSAIPLFDCPTEPFGSISGDRLLIDPKAVSRFAQSRCLA